MKIVLSKKVTFDKIREACFWDGMEFGLGDKFLSEFEKALQKLKETPEIFRLVVPERGIRRYYHKRFHFVIRYRYLKEEETLRILRLHNCSMDHNAFE